MDSLKSLMDKKQYDLVIKLTENTTDRIYLFYRISAFLALGKPLESLEVIENHREELEKDLSILIKVHIEILCILARFDEAYKEMERYKNLPYVSQQVEELLNSLPQYIREEERKTFSSKQLDDEQVKKLLASSEMNDVVMALDLIRERNVLDFLNDMRQVMINNPQQMLRSLTLFVLVQKDIDQEFKFLHIDRVITVNPAKLEPPFVAEPFNTLVKRISVEFKDPSLSENAIQMLSSHIMFIYPDQIAYTNDEIIEAVYQVSSKYLHATSENVELRCANKGLDVDNVIKLMNEIEFSLENY